MSKRRSIRPSVVLGLTLGGVLIGHTVTYRLLIPDAHARTLELARSGHGYLAGANAVGVVVAMVALAAVFLGRLLRSDDAPTWSILWRLLAFQMAAFATMEMLERLASRSGADRLMPVLAIGLPVQALVAAAIAFIARLALRAAERIGRALRARACAPDDSIAVAPLELVPPTRPIIGSPPGRAPPSVLVMA